MAVEEHDVDQVNPPKVGSYARKRLEGRSARPLVLLSAVTLVDQVDTSILRGVLPLIQDDFDLADWQLGALGFAFVFVNALAGIPAGWVADRVRRTRLIGWTLLSWSALSVLSAISRSFGQLFVARATLGFGQAIDDPASTSLLADTYPAQVRGRVFSVQQVTSFVGAGIGIGLGGVVGGAFGWQWAFALVGMPGSLARPSRCSGCGSRSAARRRGSTCPIPSGSPSGSWRAPPGRGSPRTCG